MMMGLFLPPVRIISPVPKVCRFVERGKKTVPSFDEKRVYLHTTNSKSIVFFSIGDLRRNRIIDLEFVVAVGPWRLCCLSQSYALYEVEYWKYPIN